MESLKNKIDFAAVVNVNRANPNGDPLNGNRPRINYDGTGELSDVCLKRKIRNRLLEAGCGIFVQSDDNRVDKYRSLSERAKGELGPAMTKEETLREEACKKWIDVRASVKSLRSNVRVRKKGKRPRVQKKLMTREYPLGLEVPYPSIPH